jgi:hypothetical protein
MINPGSQMGPMQSTGIAVTAMKTTPAVCPDDGLKKLSAHRFIGKRFPKRVDVHTASSLKKVGGSCINL